MAYVEQLPTAALSTQAMPAAPIPAATAFAELPYRDVAVAGISPSGSPLLSDLDGFKTVEKEERHQHTSCEEPCIGVSSSLTLPVIRKPERTKTLFVSCVGP
jgi:hypothetical protein